MKTPRAEGRSAKRSVRSLGGSTPPMIVARGRRALLAAALLAILAPSTGFAQRSPMTPEQRTCNAAGSDCVTACIRTSRSAEESRSCNAQCRVDIETCLKRGSAPAEAEPGSPATAAGPALDQEAVDALAKRIRDAITRQQQAVARVYMTAPPECQDKVAGMIRNPSACLQARSRDHAAAANSERETILAALVEAQASLDADLAALPSGQIKRYRAMEEFNSKYRGLVQITTGLARDNNGTTRDASIQAACARFERTRLAATGGQEAVPDTTDRPRRSIR